MLQILWDVYCSNHQHFGRISFVFIECRKSSRINTTLAVNGLTPLLIGKLDHQDAIARLNLLKLIKVKIFNLSPSPLSCVFVNICSLVSHTVLDEIWMESIYPKPRKEGHHLIMVPISGFFDRRIRGSPTRVFHILVATIKI
jgi:hypothetical protein